MFIHYFDTILYPSLTRRFGSMCNLGWGGFPRKPTVECLTQLLFYRGKLYIVRSFDPNLVVFSFTSLELVVDRSLAAKVEKVCEVKLVKASLN